MKEVEQFKKLMDAIDTPVTERDSIAHEPEHYDIEITADDVTVYSHGGEPVLAMPMDDWLALISRFNREMGRRR